MLQGPKKKKKKTLCQYMVFLATVFPRLFYISERLALLFNLLFSEFQIYFFFFFAKIECGLYLLDRFDVLISKMIFKK